ncbi:trypsin-like peptidase domain-containing protein [Micromonospora harpali]
MQPEGPYRFTEASGVCQVGSAWWAVDSQDRLLTVAVLEGAAAADQPWREAFTNAADTLAQTPGGPRYVNADFAAARPWVAYPAEVENAADKLFGLLGMPLRSPHLEPVGDLATRAMPATTPVAPATPTSGVPSSAVPASGQPASGVPASGVPASGVPASGVPASGVPISGPPGSGIPSSGVPVSGAPSSGAPPVWAAHATGSPVVATPPADPPVAHPGPADPGPPHDPFASPARRIQPSPPSRPRTGLRLGVAALALAVLAAGGGLAVWAATRGADAPPPAGPAGAFPTATPAAGFRPWSQAAPYSAQERALATAAPGLVFVEAVFNGYLRDGRTGALLNPTPVTFQRRCSGFVVDPAGHVLTNGQCVAPDEPVARERALYTLGRILVAGKKLTSGALDGWVRSRTAGTRFTGKEPDRPPSSQVFVQLNQATGGLTGTPAIAGEVVRTRAADAGDLALVKVARPDLPGVELGDAAALTPGGVVVVAGYHTVDADFRDATYTLRSKTVQVTATDTGQGTVPLFRIGDDIGIYSHGGVALDPAGRVVGVLTNDRSGAGGANRAVVPVTAARELLAEAGVAPTLGDADRLYRRGLDAYFTGRDATAVSQLDAVARGGNGNELAEAYRRSAADRQQLTAAAPEQSNLPTVLFSGLGGALLAALAIGVVLLARRRSRR